jgi:hypothetical protein
MTQQPGSADSAGQGGPRPGLLDGIFVVLVCALAFLLASTPARNSDLWLHLASGRWLAQGHSPRGTDPFSSTAANVFWVNHTWLSDVLLYGLYAIGGGTALVLAKAFLVAVLAGLFFCFRRRGTPMGLLAVVAGLAVVALATGLALQPALLSLLGVVLTLYLLERPSLVETDRIDRARTQRWLLVPLFALWANLDGWFVLGPVLVGLYALTQKDEGGRMKDESEGNHRLSLFILHPSSFILFVAALAACMITPYHYRTFAWPVPLGLSRAERALMSDPLGDGLVVSPFAARFVASPVFASPAAWAYYVLLAGGLVSFVWRGRSLHPGRLLAWLGLAALSAYQARAIPFFAVVAGPVLALNIQQGSNCKLQIANCKLQIGGRRRVVRGGVGVLVGLALLVLAWPGWLQPAPYRARGFRVEADDSLVRLAGQLRQWHAEQQVPDDRFGLTFSPEAAHYLAWFCPAEKGFLDSRWPLFDGVADDFVRMRRCLLQSSAAGPEAELGPLLDRYRIDRIILRDPDWERTARAYLCLLGGAEWELLALEGGAAVFGRRTAEARWKRAPQSYDTRRLAYHPDKQRRAPPAPARPPQRPGPLAAFWRGDERSADREEAALHLISFDHAAERTRLELGAQWLLAQAGGLLGCSVPATDWTVTATAVAVRLSLTPLLPSSQESGIRSQETAAPGQQAADGVFAGFVARRDQGPAEVLLLAVRAGRRALAANPDDAGALLLLGEAYLRMLRQTREQGWHGNLPTLTAIRRLQALTALEQAVLLRPDLDQAHALLVQLYGSAGYLDRALDHLRARLRIAEQQAGQRGPGRALAAERRSALKADVGTLGELVDRSLKIYEANVTGLSEPSKVYERARLAYRHGLADKALQMLLGSHPAIFGKAGAQLQLDLMLEMGRAYEVRTWLEPEHESVLGSPSYHWLRAQAAAACGAYAEVEAELDQASEQWRQVGISATQLLPVRTVMSLRVAEAVLARPDLAAGPAGLAGAVYHQFDALRPLAIPADLLRKEADSLVLRGVLAVESGDVETARRHCRAALAVWGDEHRAATSAGLDFAARPVAQQVLGLLLEKDRHHEERSN